MEKDGLKWGDPPLTADKTPGSLSGEPQPERLDPDEGRSSAHSYLERVRIEIESGEYHVDSLEIASRLLARGVLDEPELG